MNEEQLVIALRQCTRPELEAWQLHLQGLGYRRISIILGISWSTARDRVKRVQQRLDEARRADEARA